MSQIKKALKKVLDGGEKQGKHIPVVHQGVSDDSTSGIAVEPLVSRSETVGFDRQKMRARTNESFGEEFEEAEIPGPVIVVDVEHLIEQGLLPSAENIEAVGYQFRRIKRPVLKTAFGFGIPESDNANLVMIASALPQSGKTFCSVCLAASIARDRDYGAVLVDADVLKPNISRVLELENRIGLIDYLLDSSIILDDILVKTNFFDIVVVPAGKQHDDATELLSSRRMKRLTNELSQRFRSRAVIVDTPPLLLTNEAHVLTDHMGQIVMVIEAGKTTQDSVIEALKTINRSKPINVILNKAVGSVLGRYEAGDYGYYSGYGRGQYHRKEK